MGELAKTLVSLSGPDAVHGIIPKALLKAERNYIENGRENDPRKSNRRTDFWPHDRRQRHAFAEADDGG